MPRRKLLPRKNIHKSSSSSRNRTSSRTFASDTQPFPTSSIAPPLFPPTLVFTSKTGFRTEILQSLKPPSNHKHTHLIVLPGNPGLIEYYRPLCNHIRSRLPSNVTDNVSIHALGYPGHDLRQLNSHANFHIQHHVQYVCEYLHTLLPSYKTSNIVFVAHSYGSFLALSVISHLKNSSNISLVMLMPCIWQMAYCAGPLFRFFIRDFFTSSTLILTATTLILPNFLKELYINLSAQDRPTAQLSRVVLNGQHRSLFENMFFLARDEMKAILDPHRQFNKVIADIAERSLFIFAANDKWCPLEAKGRIEEVFGPPLTTHFLPDVIHGFVMHDHQTRNVAKSLVEWLHENLWLYNNNSENDNSASGQANGQILVDDR